MRKSLSLLVVLGAIIGVAVCLSTTVRATPFPEGSASNDNGTTANYPCSGVSDYAFNDPKESINVHFCHNGEYLVIYYDRGQLKDKYAYRRLKYDSIEQMQIDDFLYCSETSGRTAGGYIVYDCRDYYWFKNSKFTGNEAYRSKNYCWWTNGGDYDNSKSCADTMEEATKDGGTTGSGDDNSGGGGGEGDSGGDSKPSGGATTRGEPGHAELVKDCKRNVNDISKGGYGGLICSVGDLISQVVDGLLGWLASMMRWNYLIPNSVPDLSENPCGYDPNSQACEDYYLLRPCEKDANSDDCKKWKQEHPCSVDPDSEACKNRGGE